MIQSRVTIRAVSMLLILWLSPFPVAAEIPFPEGLLFRVESGDRASSYIFGTMHTDDPRVTQLVSEVVWALETSRILAVEVEFNELTAITAIARMFNPAGTGLRELLGDQLYLRTITEAKRLGLPEIAIDQYKPWALAVLFSLPPMESGEIPDLMLAKMARDQGKQVIGLETAEEQLSVFDELPLADQKSMLLNTLNNLDRLPMIYQELTLSYLARDLAALVRLSQESFTAEDSDQVDRFQDALIYNRNRRMAERLMDQLSTGSVFVAVGALHLPGEQGLLNILRKRGFSVEREF